MQEQRRSYRECFYTAPIGNSCSGVILFKEALTQSATDGKSFVKWLNEQSVLPGVKVDEVRLLYLSNSICEPVRLRCQPHKHQHGYVYVWPQGVALLSATTKVPYAVSCLYMQDMHASGIAYLLRVGCSATFAHVASRV